MPGNITWPSPVVPARWKAEADRYLSAYSETSCGLLSHQSYAFSSAPGSLYYSVTAALSDVGGPPEDEEPCGTTTVEPYDHSATKAYQWDEAAERFAARH